MLCKRCTFYCSFFVQVSFVRQLVKIFTMHTHTREHTYINTVDSAEECVMKIREKEMKKEKIGRKKGKIGRRKIMKYKIVVSFLLLIFAGFFCGNLWV